MSSEVELIGPNDLCADWDPTIPWYTHQLAENGGMGLMQQYGAMNEVNYEACEFIEYQFKRFGMPVPDRDLVEWAWHFAFYAVDQVDPYMFFHGFSDVFKTEEPLYYQFAVREHPSQAYEEISGEYAEFYRHFPKEGKTNFVRLYSNPGLKNFDMIYDYFTDHVTHISDTHHEGYYPDEVEFFRRYGEKVAKDWMELAVWSALIWMISPEPESKDWRYSFHPIFQIVYDEGSCLLNDWTFYVPGLFIMDERPVRSCAICGTHEWCVELTQKYDHQDVEYTCQHCLSEGEPFPGMICGTKHCTTVTCKNHPENGNLSPVDMNRKKREMEANKRYGELKQLPNGMKARENPGIIYVNTRVMDKYSKSIASDMGKVFQALLGSPE